MDNSLMNYKKVISLYGEKAQDTQTGMLQFMLKEQKYSMLMVKQERLQVIQMI